MTQKMEEKICQAKASQKKLEYQEKIINYQKSNIGERKDYFIVMRFNSAADSNNSNSVCT